MVTSVLKHCLRNPKKNKIENTSQTHVKVITAQFVSISLKEC